MLALRKSEKVGKAVAAMPRRQESLPVGVRHATTSHSGAKCSKKIRRGGDEHLW